MRYARIAIVFLAGCNADPIEGGQDDLAAPSDFAVADLAVRDLADWCPASGPPPRCNGKPCDVGCLCRVGISIIFFDLGGTDASGPWGAQGPDVGFCTCPAGDPEFLEKGPYYCCGGLACETHKGDPYPLCTPDNDCRLSDSR